MGSSFLRWCALAEAEVANPRLPAEKLVRDPIILVRVIEGTIVHRVNRHVAVIAPPFGFLAPSTVKKMLFTRQYVQWISSQSASITDLRVNRGAGSTKTERNISLVIRRNTTNPAPGIIGAVGVLLPNRPVSRECALQLEPTYACHGFRLDRNVVKHRLATIRESAIGVAKHQPITDAIQLRLCALLGHAFACIRAEHAKACCQKIRLGDEPGVSWVVPIHMKSPYLVFGRGGGCWSGCRDRAGQRLFVRWSILLHGKLYKMVRVARWWRQDAIQVRRQEEVLVISAPWSLNGGSGIAYQHLGPIKHKSLRPGKNAANKYVRGHVIAIRPDAELGIILEKPCKMKVVSVPRTGGVTGLGNGDTFV